RSFFFQAEDGIRDKLVTGVQTCALPISCAAALSGAIGEAAGDHQTGRRRAEARAAVDMKDIVQPVGKTVPDDVHRHVERFSVRRSEERRVGKECRTSRRTRRSSEKNSAT